jgi:hypothetical protein
MFRISSVTRKLFDSRCGQAMADMKKDGVLRIVRDRPDHGDGPEYKWN